VGAKRPTLRRLLPGVDRLCTTDIHSAEKDRLAKWHQQYGHNTLLGPPLAEDEGKLCVVLDMDETLLHSQLFQEQYPIHEQWPLERKPDFKLNMFKKEGYNIAHVHKRNGVDHFLQQCSEHFEVIVFTAAHPIYARPVLDIIDKHGTLIKKRLYRDSTTPYGGLQYTKNIALLGRDMKRCLLIDDDPGVMLPQPDNAFPIKRWIDDDTDTELQTAFDLLMQMKELDDVRPFLRDQIDFRNRFDSDIRFAEESEEDRVKFTYT
jgi:RNA polymerase II subunit A small phosphatase-like protein